MPNSNFISHTRISPNSSNPRSAQIKKITIHHCAGNPTVEQLGEMFQPKSRQASSNYGVGTDGRIGLYVEEKNRAWTSSSALNDNQAVTIEVANNGGAPNWTVSDKALQATVDLCADICKRNGIGRLNFTGDANGNLTTHDMFAQTNCPGPYLRGNLPYIAEQVNTRLAAAGDAVLSAPCSTTGPDALFSEMRVFYKGKIHTVPCLFKDGYNYPNLRALADVLGLTVGWDDTTKLIALTGGE